MSEQTGDEQITYSEVDEAAILSTNATDEWIESDRVVVLSAWV